MTSERPRLDDFPFTVEIPARYGDLDGNHHVNNVALAGFYEEGRVAFHRHALGVAFTGRPRPWRMLVARALIQYFGEVGYPGRYVVGQGVVRLGRASFTELGALFRADDDGPCLGQCESTMVYTEHGPPVRLPEEFRGRLAAYAVRGCDVH